QDLVRFMFNASIVKLMIRTTSIRDALDSGAGARDAVEALVLMLAPFAPFAAEELWRSSFGHEDSVHVASWPSFDGSLAAEETVTLVIQVDGKVRDRVEVSVDIDEQRCLEIARGSQAVTRALGDRSVAREIVRAPKL